MNVPEMKDVSAIIWARKLVVCAIGGRKDLWPVFHTMQVAGSPSLPMRPPKFMYIPTLALIMSLGA